MFKAIKNLIEENAILSCVIMVCFLVPKIEVADTNTLIKGAVKMAELDEDLMELEEDTQKGRYLTFTLGKEYYGIEIRYVTEIIGLQPITQVPDLSDYVKGVINLRGRIIPVMDVRLRFKKEEIDYDDRTCIIVIDINKMFIGLVVDRVSEVVNISEENISAPPNLGNSHHNKYIKGIGKIGEDVKLILDCDKLLNDEEYAVIEQSI